jgi:DNA-binding response OmpR family regulator
MHILVVDDDPGALATIRATLEESGFTVDTCTTGEEAVSMATAADIAADYDLIVLDVGLPGINGFGVAESIRGGGYTTPIVMLTAQDTEEATIYGLESGADDYITKPFSPAELLARIRAVSRRATSAQGTLRSHGTLTLNLETRTARNEDREIHLTDKEFSLIWTLAEHPIRVWSREALLERVWKIEFDPDTKVLDVHLSYLRRKLDSIGSSPIKTIHRQGWRLE